MCFIFLCVLSSQVQHFVVTTIWVLFHEKHKKQIASPLGSLSPCAHDTSFLGSHWCSWSLSFVADEQSSGLQRVSRCALLYWAKHRDHTDKKTTCLCGADIRWLRSQELNSGYSRVTPLLPMLSSHPHVVWPKRSKFPSFLSSCPVACQSSAV